MNPITKIVSALFLSFTYILTTLAQAQAQITNPAISPELGANADGAKDGSLFATYFVDMWQVVISIGGIMVLIYFLWGAIEWILAGGDQSKIQKGRDRIVQSIIGMVLLAGSFVLISLISTIFFGDAYDLLNISF